MVNSHGVNLLPSPEGLDEEADGEAEQSAQLGMEAISDVNTRGTVGETEGDGIGASVIQCSRRGRSAPGATAHGGIGGVVRVGTESAGGAMPDGRSQVRAAEVMAHGAPTEETVPGLASAAHWPHQPTPGPVSARRLAA